MDYLRRPRYHYKPARGWINDPNGLVYFQGYYHIFYQHSPNYEQPNGEPMHWGHARTKDFLHWEELPVALCPDSPYDNGGCWSGTAIVKDNVLYLAYASIHTPEDASRRRETVSIAYSADGIHFQKYAHNPVIDHFPSDGGPDFRDPALACIDGSYYCVMASGNPDKKTALLLLYESDDLFHWTYKGIVRQWEGADFAECPSFMAAGDRALLTASVCQGENRSFAVMYGRFAEGKFQPETVGSIEKGPDQYAGQVFSDPRGRNILISWIPGWDYCGFAQKDVGCMSTPVELSVRDGRVYGFPVAEVQHLLKSNDPALKRTEKGFEIARTGRGPVVYTGEITDLQMIRDEYILEVFVNGGEAVYTVLL